MLAYVETVQSKEREIRCDVYTHQKWCAPSFTTDIGDMCIFPTFCCAGAEQITSIGFCPRLHPGHRAPPPGERILPNAHSKQNVVVPLSNIPMQVLFARKIRFCRIHVIQNSVHVTSSALDAKCPPRSVNIVDWCAPPDNVSILLHYMLKVAHSEATAAVGLATPIFLRIKVRLLLLGDLISHYPITSTLLHFHNDLPCYLRSRSSPCSGHSCPSAAWRRFYHSCVDKLFILVDPESVLIAVQQQQQQQQQQQRSPVLDSHAVSSCGKEWHFILLRLLPAQQRLLMPLGYPVSPVATALHFVVSIHDSYAVFPRG